MDKYNKHIYCANENNGTLAHWLLTFIMLIWYGTRSIAHFCHWRCIFVEKGVQISTIGGRDEIPIPICVLAILRSLTSYNITTTDYPYATSVDVGKTKIPTTSTWMRSAVTETWSSMTNKSEIVNYLVRTYKKPRLICIWSILVKHTMIYLKLFSLLHYCNVARRCKLVQWISPTTALRFTSSISNINDVLSFSVVCGKYDILERTWEL